MVFSFWWAHFFICIFRASQKCRFSGAMLTKVAQLAPVPPMLRQHGSLLIGIPAVNFVLHLTLDFA
jgi:hypothetical protein